jgi:hypothetical protein
MSAMIRGGESLFDDPKPPGMIVLKTFGLFVLTAIAEIVGCYRRYVGLRKNGSPWLIVPAAASLALFAWLLTLHPAASGRRSYGRSSSRTSGLPAVQRRTVKEHLLKAAVASR